MGGACGQGCGDGAAARADFNHGAAGEITQRSGDALDCVGIMEKVLAEFRFGGHGLS
jgi:hypothetical protein